MALLRRWHSSVNHPLNLSPVPQRLQWRPFAAIALGYLVLGGLATAFFSPQVGAGIFWPASGWALSGLLIWGSRYAGAVFVGACAMCFLLHASVVTAMANGLGAVAAALVALELFKQNEDRVRSGLFAYWRLVVFVAGLGGLASAIIGTSVQLVLEHQSLVNALRFCLDWWMGDFLGILLVVPLALKSREPGWLRALMERKLETVFLMALTAALGLAVFDGWHPALVRDWVPKGYLLIPFVAWASVRLGTVGVSLVLALVTSQAIYGIGLPDGIFSATRLDLRVFDTWLYLCILNITGYSLAVAGEDRVRAASELRVAAAAFECQEGVLVTDKAARILKSNTSFSAISGYGAPEIQGRSTEFLLASRYRPQFLHEAIERVRHTNTWRGEIWSRRKNGEEFPGLVTMTAVKDQKGALTHFVITLIDLSESKLAEEKRLADELAHRQTLVREIHHRIKNNLQGVVGILRHFSTVHPETEQPITQAISLLKTIASLHGLKGISTHEDTSLVGLVTAIASDNQAIWETPIVMDVSRASHGVQITESETVPVALIVNELIVNAVKHGGKSAGRVGVKVRYTENTRRALVTITNQGHWDASDARQGIVGHGLALVKSMMPRHGAHLWHEQVGDRVATTLELQAEVLRFD